MRLLLSYSEPGHKYNIIQFIVLWEINEMDLHSTFGTHLNDVRFSEEDRGL